MTTDKVNRPAYQKTLGEHFRNSERNDAIITALEDGYTQAKIAKHLGVSRSLVCKIVKGSGVYSTPDP
ncbi:MAG: helix-turn-helix domain-containing protein [Campylobacterota bacterium]|nr:helix-turn-helix domain-containing protein [Campylobacterota bacterium]